MIRPPVYAPQPIYAPQPGIRLVIVLDPIAMPPEQDGCLPSWIVPGNAYTYSVAAHGSGPQPGQVVQDVARDIARGAISVNEARSRLCLKPGCDSC